MKTAGVDMAGLQHDNDEKNNSQNDSHGPVFSFSAWALLADSAGGNTLTYRRPLFYQSYR